MTLGARRVSISLLLLALLVGGCQTTGRPGAWSRAQQTYLRGEGFVTTDRGWEFSMNDKLTFPTDRSEVLPAQKATILRIARGLLGVGIRHATVEGHADDTGGTHHNQRLSEQRAAAVAAMLVAGGFGRADVDTVGLGERFPVESNETPEGRQENRRVVILIRTP